jgi:hypothetical protein
VCDYSISTETGHAPSPPLSKIARKEALEYVHKTLFALGVVNNLSKLMCRQTPSKKNSCVVIFSLCGLDLLSIEIARPAHTK